MKLFWLLSLFFFSTGTALGNGNTATFDQSFQAYLDEHLAELPGYAVAVIVDGDYKISKTQGVRRLGSTERIDEDTVFRLASVSKTFTPAVVALTGKGDLHFDSAIRAFLPELKLSNPQFTSQITVRHLLSHSSGLVPHAYTNLVEAGVPYQKIVSEMDNVEFVCKPGKCYGYQNVAYSLVGDVVSHAGKSTYEEIAKSNVLAPLGMTHASFGHDAFMSAQNRATPHRWNRQNQRWKPVDPNKNYYRLSPAAGLNASLSDMKQWLNAQLGKTKSVLTKQILDSMHRPHIKTSRRHAHYHRALWEGVSEPHYALGWRTFTFNGEEGFVHHGGWVAGVRAEIILNRRLNMGMVFLTNSEPSVASDVVPMFIRTYLSKHKNNS